MRKFLYAFLLFGVFYFSIMMISCNAAEHFEYVITEDNRAVVTKYTGRDTVVNIPSELGGAPVCTIGAESFLGCERITAVMIPESVTSIEEYAFEYCTSLETIEIPEGVTLIGCGAFKHCADRKSVV